MKKSELENTISEINKKVQNIEDLQQKISDADSKLDVLNRNINQSQNSKQEIEKFRNQIEQINNDAQSYKKIIEDAKSIANEYKKTVDTQKEEYSQLKENIENLENKAKELEGKTEEQLGRVSMESLAYSFCQESGYLNKELGKWLKWLSLSVLVLFFVVVFIVIMQVFLGATSLFSLSFVVKLSITAPLIYFIVFVNQQYNRDKKLLDEYRFKSSVARSFESYRKILEEEADSSKINNSSNEKDPQHKKLDFILETIKNLYNPPTDKINAENEGDESHISVQLLQKITEIFKKIKQ